VPQPPRSLIRRLPAVAEGIAHSAGDLAVGVPSGSLGARSLDDRLVGQREPSRAGRGVVTTESTPAVGAPSRRLAVFAVTWPVLVVAGLMLAGLLVVSGAYGFHGDEMY
jgi:hypothetical protein